MNGQISPSVAIFPGAGLFSHRARVSARLAMALMASCLLHAAILVTPYLGGSSRESRTALQGGQVFPRAFTATLTTRSKAAFSIGNLPIAGERSANLSPLERGSSEESRSAQAPMEGADLMPVQAPVFYPTNLLSKRPQPLAEADLDTPGISPIVASGKMILKLWINEFGAVVEVEIEKTELPEAFSRTAVAAFKRLRFLAGERYGRPVGSVMRIEVSYDDGRLPSP